MESGKEMGLIDVKKFISLCICGKFLCFRVSLDVVF